MLHACALTLLEHFSQHSTLDASLLALEDLITLVHAGPFP
jgi:hypothetical protein